MNDANQFYSATAGQVADLFLEKRTTWLNGTQVSPVDQMPEAQVREEFSVAVLGRPLQAVQAYWRAKVYREDLTPPPELTSDQARDRLRPDPPERDRVRHARRRASGRGVHAVVVMR